MSYIEREALREELRHCCIVAFDEKSGEPYVIDIPQLLRRTTVSADVAPVVHGRWLNFTGDFSTAECDQCGELYEVSPDEKPCEDYFNAFKQFYKFCPNCGADMRRESEESK